MFILDQIASSLLKLVTNSLTIIDLLTKIEANQRAGTTQLSGQLSQVNSTLTSIGSQVATDDGVIKDILAELRGESQAVSGTLRIYLEGDTVGKELVQGMAFKHPVDQTSTIKATFTDKFGNAATTDPNVPIVMALSDPSLGAIVVAADGSGTLTPTGKEGTAQVSVTADADLGAGVKTVSLLGDVEFIAGAAVAGAVVFTLNNTPPPTGP